jgi:hypothetical protein
MTITPWPFLAIVSHPRDPRSGGWTRVMAAREPYSRTRLEGRLWGVNRQFIPTGPALTPSGILSMDEQFWLHGSQLPGSNRRDGIDR